MRRASAALPLALPAQVDKVWLQALNEIDDEEVRTFKQNCGSCPLPGTRVNNHIEAWHLTMNCQLNCPIPNIFALIELLQTEQERVKQQLRLLNAGDEPPRQRPMYKRTTERLVTLRRRLVNKEIDVYHNTVAVTGTLKQDAVRQCTMYAYNSVTWKFFVYPRHLCL